MSLPVSLVAELIANVGGETADSCIDLKLVTEPKTSHIQIISGISTPKPITFAPGKLDGALSGT